MSTVRSAAGGSFTNRATSRYRSSLPTAATQTCALRRWQERLREAGNEGFGDFTFVEVGGDPERIRAPLSDAHLPIRFVSGRPGLHAVGISGPTREIVLRDTA